MARAEGREFAVPASVVASVEIAREERWAELGGDKRGVLWEGRYLFVTDLPGGAPVDVRGRGEFPFLVVRGAQGFSAIVIERFLGEVLAVREEADPPWAGRIRAEGREYPVLAVAAPAPEEPPVERQGEFRGAPGIAFIGDVQAGVSPEAVAETLAASGWRPVLVTIGGDEDAGREGGSHPRTRKGGT